MCVCPVTQSCLTLCDPLYCSPPSSSLHKFSQARISERVAISYSRRSSLLSDQAFVSCIFCISRQFFTTVPPQKTPYIIIIYGIYTCVYTYIISF